MFSFCVDHRTLSFKMKKKIPPICRIGFLKKEFSSVWNVWRAKQWNSIVRAHFLRWFVERGCHFIHGQTGGSCLAIMPRYQHFASLHVAVNRKHLVLEISRNSWMHLEIVRDRNCSRSLEYRFLLRNYYLSISERSFLCFSNFFFHSFQPSTLINPDVKWNIIFLVQYSSIWKIFQRFHIIFVILSSFFCISRKYASSSFCMIRLPFSPSYFSINLLPSLPSFFYRNVTRKKWTDTIYLASLLCSN